MTRFGFRTVVGLTVSGIFLYFAIRRINLLATWTILSGVQVVFLIFAAAIYLVATWVRAWRWLYLFEGLQPRVSTLFAATAVGYMVNNILPLRLGELARSHYLTQKADVQFPQAFATILVERFLDLLAALILVGITFFFVQYPAWVVKGFYLAFVLTAALAAALFVIRHFRNACRRVITTLAGYGPAGLGRAFGRGFESFRAGLGALRMGRHLVPISLLSILLWLCYSMAIIQVFRSFGWDMPPSAPWGVLAFMNLAMMIPSAPGQLGTVQFFLVLILGLYGVQKEAAFSFSVVLHFVIYVTMTTVGLFYFIGAQVPLGRVARMSVSQAAISAGSKT